MIFFRVLKYLKYKLLSGHRKGHGIHSPFAFDLVCRVFRNKTDSGIVCTIRAIRKKLTSDKRVIYVNDLGAGSEKFKTNLRKVSQIAKYSSVPEKYGILLSNMAAEFGHPFIVELGTSLGISTMYLAMANKEGLVRTVEGCRETSEIAIENFKDAGIKNIDVLNGSFDDILPEIINEENRPGLIFIDGNHRKEPLLRYFTLIAGAANSETVVIIDDINYSGEMEEAWNEIKRFRNVSVSVDLLRMGIVFFRQGITHNDYIIRY